MIPETELANPRSATLDSLDPLAVVTLMNEEEQRALDAVAAASAALAQVAGVVADSYARGHRIVYVATGTSGFIATMDAAELPPTFGADRRRYLALTTSHGDAPPDGIRGASEDDDHAAAPALAGLGIGDGDVVIGIAASGTTPIVTGAVVHARGRGATTVGIANAPGTALLAESDVPVLLDTGAEVVTGSTRLKAGTAQKLALNRISTAAMVILGAVVSNHMVEVRPANAKLRARCIRTVSELAGIAGDEAERRLERCDWSIRRAIADAP